MCKSRTIQLFPAHSSYRRTNVLEQISRLPCAPSVGMHDVPREDVGTHLGMVFDDDDMDIRDDLDRQLYGG